MMQGMTIPATKYDRQLRRIRRRETRLLERRLFYAKFLVAFFGSVLMLCVVANAQQTPAAHAFSIQATALSLTGGNQTVPAAETGLTYDITTNLALRTESILAPSNNVQAYLAGVNYSLPNKVIPKSVSANGIRFYVTGSVGINRIVPATGTSQQHIAASAGGGLNYSPNGTFSVNLFEVRWARLPGLDSNAVLVSSGVKLSF